MERKVISFPQKRSQRVIEARKSESKQVLTALSVLSLVLVAVFANEQVLKSNRPMYIVSDNSDAQSMESLNRAIASSQPFNPMRDVEFEQRLAKRLAGDGSADERTPASFGRPATTLDQVRFGALDGKYHIQNQQVSGQTKIGLIEYVESLDAGAQPKFIDRAQFLREYKDLFPILFSKFHFVDQKLTTKGSTEVYELEDAVFRKVGQAIFTLDEDGRFLSLKFSQE